MSTTSDVGEELPDTVKELAVGSKRLDVELSGDSGNEGCQTVIVQNVVGLVLGLVQLQQTEAVAMDSPDETSVHSVKESLAKPFGHTAFNPRL